MKRRAAPAARRGAARATNAYLYGVVRWPVGKAVHRALDKGGVGDPPAPVRALRHHDVAALVSDVLPGQISDTTAVRAMRRDLRAHSAVLNRVTEHGTILPVRYGTVLPDDACLLVLDWHGGHGETRHTDAGADPDRASA